MSTRNSRRKTITSAPKDPIHWLTVWVRSELTHSAFSRVIMRIGAIHFTLVRTCRGFDNTARRSSARNFVVFDCLHCDYIEALVMGWAREELDCRAVSERGRVRTY